MRRCPNALTVTLLVVPLMILSGCARMNGAGFMPAPRVADEQLLFIDRLATASPEQLNTIGERLRTDVDSSFAGPIDSLRHALWMATPGHDGYDPAAASERLKQLLIAEHLGSPLRALIRIELRHLLARAEFDTELAKLTERSRDLSAENERLHEKIQALTALERRMGSGQDQDSNGAAAEP